MVNIDKVLDEMMANSDMSFGEFKQMLAQSAERAYKEKQAREEEKKRSDWATAVSKRLCDVANNALNKKLTPEDVTYICQLYAKQEHPEVKDEAWDTLMFADDIKSSIDTCAKLYTGLDKYLNAIEMSWSDISKELRDKRNKKPTSYSTDDDIIRNFINTL